MADDYKSYSYSYSAVKRGTVNCTVHGVVECDEYVRVAAAVTLLTPVGIH